MTSHNAFEREHVLSRTNEFTRCSNTGTIVHRIRITNLGHLECDELVTYIQIGRVVPSGIAEDGTGFLVTEFMDGGSLDRALWAGEGGENVSTSWTQRVGWQMGDSPGEHPAQPVGNSAAGHAARTQQSATERRSNTRPERNRA